MRQPSADRPLRQRIVALAAAYAVALSSLVASYSLARAVGTAAAVPGGVVCHTISDLNQAPASDQIDHCADNCCIGCITLLAALPPPPTEPAEVLLSSGQRLPPPARVSLFAPQKTASHRSRAPPSAS